MAEKRRGLGRGLGALIPNAPTGDARPVDVFFPGGTPVVERPVDLPSQDESDRPGAERSTDGATEGDEPQADPGAQAPAPGSRVPAPHGDAVVPDGGLESTTRHDAVSGDGRSTDDPAGQGGAASQEGVAEEPGGRADDGLVPVPGARFAEIPVTAIRPNPRQPRTVFDEEALDELVGSIREIGVLQPVVVRPLPDTTDDGTQYELIMGERRWRATQAAGLSTIPAIIRETDDADLLRDALLENLHRSELNALEEAAAYQQLLDDFGCTHDELAQRIHRSRPQISNTLRLLRLPPLVQRRVAAGVLSAGHARALLGLADAGAMERLAQRIVAEGLSVRATEEVVSLGGDAEGGSPRPSRRPRAGDRNMALDDLAARLSDKLDTRVKVNLGKSKGRITVEFASVQDLNRILATLTPDDPGVLR